MKSLRLFVFALSAFFAVKASCQNAITGNAADTNINGAIWNMYRSSLTNINALNASTITTTGSVTAATATISNITAVSVSGNAGAMTHYSASNLDGTLGSAQMPSAAQTYEDTRPILFANFQATNISIGNNLILASTTNAVHNAQAGDANMVGNFQTNNLPGILTNLTTHAYIALITGIYYFETTNATIQYSSANLFTTNWTKVNGPLPVPKTSAGVILDPTSIAFLGSTLGAQFFGFTPYTQAQVDAKTNALQFTPQIGDNGFTNTGEFTIGDNGGPVLKGFSDPNNANDYILKMGPFNVDLQGSTIFETGFILNAPKFEGDGSLLTNLNLSADGGGLTNLNYNSFSNAQSSPVVNESIASRYWVVTNANPKGYNINLQAILDSFPHSTSRTNVGGGTLVLNGGIYYTGGATYSANSQGVDTVKIVSANHFMSCIVFTNNSGLTLGGSGNNMGFEAEGVVFASLVDSNYFLVHIKNNNRTVIHNCTFTYWPMAINNGGLGLEIGLSSSASPANSLGGVWYDGGTTFGDVFDFSDNNLDGLPVGFLDDGNHLRFDNNFLEKCGNSSTWPTNDVLGFGGGLIIGRTSTSRFFSFSGKGNHWFDAGYAVVIGSPLTVTNEVHLIDNQFELGNLILMQTNSPTLLYLDGCTYGGPVLVTFATNAAGLYFTNGTTLPPAGFSYRIGTNFIGNAAFTSLSGNISGNGSGLTNIPYIKGLTSSQITYTPTSNPDGSTNISATITSVPLSALPVPAFVNLRQPLVDVNYGALVGYQRLTNFTEVVTNLFFGNPGQGTITNINAGWYSENAAVTIEGTSGAAVFKFAFFTNGVLAGIEEQNNLEAFGILAPIEFLFSHEQIFFLSANTRCEWRIAEDTGEAYAVKSATVSIKQ